MAAKSPKQNPKAPVRTRVNVRGFVILGVVLLVGALSIIPFRMFQEGRLRRSALDQASASAKRGEKAQAIRLLDVYLRSWPTDAEALEIQGRLLAETARNDADMLGAASVNDQLLRLEPAGKHARDARRRVIDMYIKHGDLIRENAALRGLQSAQATELRYRAAETLARTMVKEAPGDAESHRLLAMALDGEAASGDATAQPEAIAEFEKSLAIEPTDTVSARRLAMIHIKRRNDPAAADRIMDALLRAKPDGVDVRMARHDVALALKREDRAQAEIAAAVALAPESFEVRYAAAYDALRVRDTKAARAHLDAMPKDRADSIDVRYLRGLIDFTDAQPDEAIDEWRKGLTAVGGGSAELTFELAQILLKMGRVADAKPLIEQYRRLEPDDTKPMSRLLRAMFEERAGRPSRAIKDLELARDHKDLNALRGAELNLVLGRCYASIGDESRALAAFRRAATAIPQSMEPRRAIARLIQAQNPEGAINEMEAGLRSAPEDPAAMAELARLYINRQSALPEGQRNWDRPTAILARAGQVAPDDPAVLASRADLLAATNRLDEAVSLLSKATEGPSKSRPEVWQALVVGLVRQGHVDQALKALDRAEAPDAAGEHADLRLIRARLLVQTGHAQAARDLLDKSPEGVPPRERANLARNRGDLLRELGDRAGARRAFAEWARLSPDDSLPGLILVEMGQAGDDEASRLGLEALRSVGGDEEPYGLAARALSLLGVEPKPGQATPPERLDQADRLIDKLQGMAPQLPVGHLLRGIALERRQRPQEAIGELKQSLKSNTQGAALSRLVGIYTRLKRYDDLAELRRQVGATQVDQLSATAALQLGDKERAEQIAAQLVEGQPDSLQFRSAQAQLLRELGRPLEAQETLRELTVRQHDQPGPWLALLLFQVNQKDLPGAKATVERAAKTYKGDRPDLLIARCRWLAGETEAASKLYEDALAQHPDDLNTLKSAAEFNDAAGRPEKAEAILRRCLKLDPSASWASRWLAILLSAKPNAQGWAEAWSLIAPGASGSGDLPEDRLIRATVLARSPEAARRTEAMPALTSLAEDLPASSPIAIEARVRLGQEYLDARRPADAARIVLPSADDASVPNPAALAIAVESLSKTDRPAEAQERLDRLVAIEPRTPRSVAARAWVARANGKVDEAVAGIEGYFPELEAAPNGEPLALAMVNILGQFDRPEAVERIARRISARWPRDAWILARFLIVRDRIAEALEACQAAADAGSPREALEAAVSALERHGKEAPVVDRVATLVEAARAKDPNNPGIIVSLATVRHMQGRYDDELALYRDAIEVNPAGVAFLNNMAWTLSEAKGDYAGGLKLVDEAIRRVGRIAPFLDTRGTILTRLGRDGEAIKDLEESAGMGPDPVTYYHLARAYLKAGRAEDRRKARDLAKQAGFDPEKLDPSDRADVAAVMKP